MTFINFMIIGAAKSATTSLYRYLADHPQVYLSSYKEPKFFQFENEAKPIATSLDLKIYESAIKNFEEYRALFSNVKDEIAIGEASATYLYIKDAALKIYQRFPEIKLIAILRHPADRAYSHYLHTRYLGHEPLSFTEALAEEDRRIQLNWGDSWHYRREGLYAEQVERYLNLFGREQLKVYLYDDLCSHPQDLIRDVYNYLGVRSDFIPPNLEKKYNVRTVPRDSTLNYLLNEPNLVKASLAKILPEHLKKKIWLWLDRKNRVSPEVIEPAIRKSLTDYYREDILRLQDLIDKDLSKWLA
jgi:Sulfotransferase family